MKINRPSSSISNKNHENQEIKLTERKDLKNVLHKHNEIPIKQHHHRQHNDNDVNLRKRPEDRKTKAEAKTTTHRTVDRHERRDPPKVHEDRHHKRHLEPNPNGIDEIHHNRHHDVNRNHHYDLNRNPKREKQSNNRNHDGTRPSNHQNNDIGFPRYKFVNHVMVKIT